MIVAVVIDHHLVEPAAVVVCEDRLSAVRAVASYLEATAPTRVSTGQRLDPKPADADLEDWVGDVLDDIEGIDVDYLEASSAGAHQAWCHANAAELRRMHTPRVQTIVTVKEVL